MVAEAQSNQQDRYDSWSGTEEYDRIKAEELAEMARTLTPVASQRFTVLPAPRRRRKRAPEQEACKCCGHSYSVPGTEVVGGICGTCADELRADAQANEMDRWLEAGYETAHVGAMESF